MTVVQLKLSRREAKICSGACLTYGFVPFHKAEQSRRTPEDLARLDDLRREFVQLRQEVTAATREMDVTLTEGDLNLLIEVFDALIEEHLPVSEHSDYDLALHVGPREEVEALLTRLRSIRLTQTA